MARWEANDPLGIPMPGLRHRLQPLNSVRSSRKIQQIYPPSPNTRCVSMARREAPTPCLPLGTVLSPFLFPQQHHASLYQSHDLCPQAGAEDCPNSSTTRTTATRTIPINIDVTSILHARDVAPSKIACHLALFRLVSCTLDGRTFKTDRRAAKRPSDMSHVPTSTHLPARVGKWAGRADA